MAIIVYTEDPEKLLQSIKETIDGGEIATWAYDSDGDFSHTAPQWNKKAWLRPNSQEDRIVFNILSPLETKMSRTVYAVYHGRFIEMLLSHFDLLFASARATALPTKSDVLEP